MASKYEIQRLNGGWVVVMSASGHIVAKFFQTEQEAELVREEFEHGGRTVENKRDVWLIGDIFVCEPSVDGQQIGEVAKLDMRQYNVVETISQAEFDAMVEAFFEEHGHYPDS